MAVTVHAGEIESDTVIAEVGDVTIVYSQIRCVEGVRGTDRCISEEKDKLRGRIATALIGLGAQVSGVGLTVEELSEIEAPSQLEKEGYEHFVFKVQCLMSKALTIKRGETPRPGDCGEDEQSLQHVLGYYTINDLERILAKDLMAEVEAAGRESRINSALLGKVYELRGDSAYEFWKNLYETQVRFPREEYRVRPAFAGDEEADAESPPTPQEQ